MSWRAWLIFIPAEFLELRVVCQVVAINGCGIHDATWADLLGGEVTDCRANYSQVVITVTRALGETLIAKVTILGIILKSYGDLKTGIYSKLSIGEANSLGC